MSANHHDHSHDHSHGHGNAGNPEQRRRLLIALGLTWGFAVVEAVAGWQSSRASSKPPRLKAVPTKAALVCQWFQKGRAGMR